MPETRTIPPRRPAGLPARRWSVREEAPEPAAMPRLTRACRIAWLEADGSVASARRAIPEAPPFPELFSAIGRGATILTDGGPVAVEDLTPGARVLTATGPLTLRWMGALTLPPGARDLTLYRVPADSLGPARPFADLLLGPAARLARADAIPARIAELADGMSVVEIRPASPVEVFHLAFDRPATLDVCGLGLAALDPASPEQLPDPRLADLYLSLFPHLHEHPRAPTGVRQTADARISGQAAYP